MYKHVIILVAATLLASSSSYGLERLPSKRPQDPATVTPSVPGVIYVKLRAGASYLKRTSSVGHQIQSIDGSKFQAALTRLRVLEMVPFDAHAPKDQITSDLGIDRMYCVYYADLSIDPHTAGAMLLATGDVELVSARYKFPISFTPNDPGLGNQYSLNNLRVIQAWEHTKGDTSIVIADVDCAINVDHEDLKGALKINWGEIGLDKNGKDKRTNGIDDDGDGVIDDWQGVDVVGGPTRSSSAFVPDGNPRPDDPTMSHGTETAGCISAVGNNGVGMAGVAYGCKLLPIKASDNANNITGGYEGIHWAVTHGARIVNCSWGGVVATADAAFADVFLQEAVSRNSLVVAAAGNASTNNDIAINYPSNGTGVLSVGASDENDAAANFSNFGHTVSVWAPGSAIYTTAYPGDNSYSVVDGTSFSSPLTAGVAGLVATMHPEWPPKFIAEQIVLTCDNAINGGNDRKNYWGRVNANAALETVPTTPGLLPSAYSVNNVVSDSLGLPGAQSTINVTFKNYLGAGVGVSAKLIPLYGGSVDESIVQLGDLSTGGTASGTFHLTRPGIYSQGSLALRFALQDTKGYVDTATLVIPLKHSEGFAPNFTATYASSVKRVDNQTGWVAFGYEQTGSALSGYARESNGTWTMPTSFGSTKQPVYCVEALDDQTAWLGSGANATSGAVYVYNTIDGGFTWNSVALTNITSFVNTIHFFDDHHGILIGDPKNLKWGIATTIDGGTTWKALTSKIQASNGLASWNNSAAWVGSYGWYGTNSSLIFRTTDAGATWKSSPTPFQHSLSLAMDDDTVHGIACFRPAALTGTTTLVGKSGLGLTTDRGVTWNSMNMPDNAMQPGSVIFIPRSHIAIVTSDRGTYRTSDFGSTWTPVGAPVPMVSDINDLAVSTQDSTFTLTASSAANGIASYTGSYSPIPQKPSGNSGVGDVQQAHLSLTNTPNPFSTLSTISYSLPVSGIVRIAIVDATGRERMIIHDGFAGEGSHSETFDGSRLEPGVYYCTLTTTAGMRITKVITLMR